MGKLKDKICVDGYNPFNGFNIFLSAVGGIDWMYIIFFIATGDGKALFQDMGIIILLVGLCCFLLLLFRNRKLKSVPKMIIFSLLSMILGAVIVVVGFIVYLLLAMFGGGTSSIGNNNKWKKQFSQSKGEYSTDGQGNFKDQHGNDVYNPQKVEDYNKL